MYRVVSRGVGSSRIFKFGIFLKHRDLLDREVDVHVDFAVLEHPGANRRIGHRQDGSFVDIDLAAPVVGVLDQVQALIGDLVLEDEGTGAGAEGIDGATLSGVS